MLASLNASSLGTSSEKTQLSPPRGGVDRNEQAVKHSRRLNSSAIPFIELDVNDDNVDDTGTLQVTFANGQSYTYHGISKSEFEAFANAPSPGRFWHVHFKGR